jgi:hypothetical protein
MDFSFINTVFNVSITPTLHLTSCVAAKYNISRHLFGVGALGSEQKQLQWYKQAPIYLLAGLTAEMVSGVIWTPMDVAKSRLQRGTEGHNSARRLLTEVYRKEGYRGLFRVS